MVQRRGDGRSNRRLATVPVIEGERHRDKEHRDEEIEAGKRSDGETTRMNRFAERRNCPAAADDQRAAVFFGSC